MPLRKPGCVVLTLVVLGGCVSTTVRDSAAVGALAGAAAGAGLGVLLSDEDLLGSPAKPETGDTSIDSGMGVGAGLAIGALFGAIFGAMSGHIRDRGDSRVATVEEDDDEQYDLGLDEEELELEEARSPGFESSLPPPGFAADTLVVTWGHPLDLPE